MERGSAAKTPIAFAAVPVLAVVALKCALTLAVAGRYGWHRDELYYAVAGLHLQGGYVEFPPVTALLAALARELFGWSLVGLRAFSILAGAGTVIVATLITRELGGGRRAQTLGAVIVAFSPGLLATNYLFQPVSLDQLATIVVLWLALRLALGRGSWPLLGDRRRHRAGDEVHDRRRPRAADRNVRGLATRRSALVGVSAGGRNRGRADGSEPRLGGGPRLDERALLRQPAAERQR